MQRKDNRSYDELRCTNIYPYYLRSPYGSVLIEVGYTKVICSVSVENKVPLFLKDTNQGWLTAEYSMLPGATSTRNSREVNRGKVNGRTAEIQRLIGRSLRAICDLSLIPQLSFYVDCDVIEADGGTRTAAITGSYVALELACRKLLFEKKILKNPIKESVAAISVGMNGQDCLLDLSYEEDYRATVDMNVVMTSSGRLIEVQGTAEEEPFSKKDLDKMLNLADKGVKALQVIQEAALND